MEVVLILGGIVYGVVVFLLYFYMFLRQRGKTIGAVKKGVKQLIGRLPMLIAIFLLIALFDVFVPKEVVISTIGKGRGFLSVVISALLGMIMMGPVASSFPLGAMLLVKGATIASVAAFLYSWVMLGVTVIPLEVSIFGRRFAIVRNALAFMGVIVMGMLVGIVLTGGIS